MAGEIRFTKVPGNCLGFKNFAGKEGPYNREGERSFSVFLDEDYARQLQAEGWNVKFPKPKDFEPGEEDTRRPYLTVNFTFEKIPPKIVLVSGEQLTPVGPDEASMLDWAEIEEFDAVIAPSHWSVLGNSGIKAYLRALGVTLKTSGYDSKYGF